jgi:hypothetical protein
MLWPSFFSTLIQEEAITTTIEFVRLVDMCGVTGMESPMAEHINAVILADPAPESLMGRPPDINTYCLTSQHIFSAASLPAGHPAHSIGCCNS